MPFSKKPLNTHAKKIANKLAVLKNTSELMIYLAYTSLILNSQELAEEVQMLEEQVDQLHYDFELLVISCGFKPEEYKDFIGLMRIGEVTERIADAASKIADVVLRGLEPHPVMKLVIEEAEETVTRVQISKKSSLIDKTLRVAKIPEETGMWVLVIRRGKSWLRPKPATIINADDILIASGYADGEEDLKKLALE
jgi:uncharacterized protein with PhoU and TrkA domain